VPQRPSRTCRLSVAVALVTLLTLVLGVAPATAQTDESTGPEQAFRGTLRDADREPVSGVTIAVASTDEVEIGTAISADDGSWSVPVPEPGRYIVSIDVDTLPDGAVLQDPDRVSITPTIRAGQDQTVLFAIGERTAGTTSRVDRLSNLAAEGVKFGLMIALAALGLSMVFGVTGLVNFAHGELLAFGAILTWWLERGYTPAPAMPLLVAAAIAIVATALFAAVWEIGIFGPVRRRKSGAIAAMVISIGLALVVRHLWLILAGSRPDFYLSFRIQPNPLTIGPVSMPPKAWATIVIASVVLLAVGWALKNTRIGTAMRAVSVNKDLAESSGIDVQRVTIVTWLAGGALAGLSGVLFGIAESVRWNMGNDVLLLIFAAVVLGGLGTAYGAMLGGLVVGLVTQLSTYWFPTELKLMFALLVLVIILLFRPQGILGVRERFG
jgi:neutral amino acid transport system permease protein